MRVGSWCVLVKLENMNVHGKVSLIENFRTLLQWPHDATVDGLRHTVETAQSLL